MTTQTLTLTQSQRLTAALQIIGASLLLALSAHLRILLPWTPVPIVLTPTLAVAFGLWLGPVRGALAAALYLLEGAVGLPVFAAGGGLAYLAGPTAGYLAGYIPGAYLAGTLAQSWTSTGWRRLGVLLIGHLPIYLLGAIVLSAFIGWNAVLVCGLLPFLPGCLLKSLALASWRR